jgi:hypothetical protein
VSDADDQDTNTLTDVRPPRAPLDLLLLLRALPLARQAQQVSDAPVPKLVADMSAARRRSRAGPERIALAAARATARWARWFGGIDTCLTRSLAAGAMLAGSGEVVLHVGFRPGQEERIVDGHAWITVDGEPVGADGRVAGEPYTRVLSIPFEEAREAES